MTPNRDSLILRNHGKQAHLTKHRAGQPRISDRSHLSSASLSIECAGSLSLFFFACVTLMLFMNAVKLQTRENLLLSNKARKLAAAASVLEGGGSSAADASVSGSGTASGTSGTSASASPSEGGTSDGLWIDIPKTVTYSFPFSVFAVPRLRIAARARVYPWVGTNGSISAIYGGGGSGSGEVIYLTDNQSVYHTHADCTHLDLAIIKTTTADVGSLRNADGRRYRKCRGFPKNYSGDVYVTAQGTYYYPSTSYGSLTRHVHIAKKSDHSSLKQCARCAARDQKAGAA